MPDITDNSVDLVAMDPPYYNNVMYAELSDYFYVWQKRTLSDLYPDLFLAPPHGQGRGGCRQPGARWLGRKGRR